MKKLLILIIVLCLALGTAGAALSAFPTNPYSALRLGGEWDAKVEVRELPLSNAMFPADFDPTLRDSFIDMLAGLQNESTRLVFAPLLDSVSYYELWSAGNGLSQLPYNIRMAVVPIVDQLPKYLKNENWSGLQAMLEDVLTIVASFEDESFNPKAYAELLTNLVKVAYTTLRESDVTIQFNDLVLPITWKQAFDILWEVYDTYESDITAIVAYVMANPTILTDLGWMVGYDYHEYTDYLDMLAAPKATLLGYKSAAGVTGSGTLNITADPTIWSAVIGCACRHECYCGDPCYCEEYGTCTCGYACGCLSYGEECDCKNIIFVSQDIAGGYNVEILKGITANYTADGGETAWEAFLEYWWRGGGMGVAALDAPDTYEDALEEGYPYMAPQGVFRTWMELAGDYERPAYFNVMQTGADSFVLKVAYLSGGVEPLGITQDDVVVVEPVYILETYQVGTVVPPGPGPSGGGSSGCNAGMTPVLLLGLAFLPFFRKK